MDFSYVTEEVVLTRKAGYKTPEWEQENKIYDAIRFHYAKLQASSLEKADGYSSLHLVNISHLEMRSTDSGFYFKAVYSTAYTDHAGFALEEISKQDTTHCLALRVVMQHPDPADYPWLALKKTEDQCVRFGRELWEKAVSVNETQEGWTGNLTCAMELPDHTYLPAELADAWKKISNAYTTDGDYLINDQIEEFEGSMSGGAYIWFEVNGSELSDLLAQLQSLSDACSKLGGKWTTDGCLCSDFAVLSFETDDDGRIIVKYLSL